MNLYDNSITLSGSDQLCHHKAVVLMFVSIIIERFVTMKTFYFSLGLLILSGCISDETIVTIYSSDVDVALNSEIVEVPITASFELLGEDDQGLLEQVSAIARNYMAPDSSVQRVESMFGQMLVIKTTIPMGKAESLSRYLKVKPRLMSLHVQDNSKQDSRIFLMEYAQASRDFNNELSNINFLLSFDTPAISNKIRIISDSDKDVHVKADAIWNMQKPYFHFDSVISKREEVELEFKGSDASVYSQLPINFFIKTH